MYIHIYKQFYMCICIWVYMDTDTDVEIYCKALVVHAIMEAEKYRPDRGEPVVPFQSQSKGLRSRRADGIISSLSLSWKAGKG